LFWLTILLGRTLANLRTHKGVGRVQATRIKGFFKGVSKLAQKDWFTAMVELSFPQRFHLLLPRQLGQEYTNCSDCGECVAVCPVGALVQ